MALVDFVFLYSMAKKAKLLLDESMVFNLVEAQQPSTKGTCRIGYTHWVFTFSQL